MAVIFFGVSRTATENPSSALFPALFLSKWHHRTLKRKISG